MQYKKVLASLIVILFATSALAASYHLVENRKTNYPDVGGQYKQTAQVRCDDPFIIERRDGNFDVFWAENTGADSSYELIRNESLGGIRHMTLDGYGNILSIDTKLVGRTESTAEVQGIYASPLSDGRILIFSGEGSRGNYLLCNGSFVLEEGDFLSISFLDSPPVAYYGGKWVPLSSEAVLTSSGNLIIFRTDFYMNERHDLLLKRYVLGKGHQEEEKIADDLFFYSTPAATAGENDTVYLVYQNHQGNIMGGTLKGTGLESSIAVEKASLPLQKSKLVLKIRNSTLHMLEIDDRGNLYYRQFDTDWRLLRERNLTKADYANLALTDSGVKILFTNTTGDLCFTALDLHGNTIVSPQTLITKRYASYRYY